ncbi:hypothetical protein E4T56_gene4213, partial [Termitomyces sp. T112]
DLGMSGSPAAGALDPRRAFVSATAYGTDVTDYARWWKMPAGLGTQTLRSAGMKVARYADMPEDWRAMVDKADPAMAADPMDCPPINPYLAPALSQEGAGDFYAHRKRGGLWPAALLCPFEKASSDRLDRAEETDAGNRDPIDIGHAAPKEEVALEHGLDLGIGPLGQNAESGGPAAHDPAQTQPDAQSKTVKREFRGIPALALARFERTMAQQRGNADKKDRGDKDITHRFIDLGQTNADVRLALDESAPAQRQPASDKDPHEGQEIAAIGLKPID